MFTNRSRQVYETGDVDAGVWSLGMCAGLIHDVPSCDELAKRFEREAEQILEKTNGLRSERARL